MAKSEPKPKREKYTPRYWNSEITAAKERHKRFWELAEESIKVYNATHRFDDLQRRLNCWWYLIQTLLPAYYSSTPKVEVGLRKRAGGTIYQLTSTILERSTQYAMDEDFNFDQVGLNSALRFLLTGRAILWASYEADIEKQPKQYGLLRTPTGLVDINGNPFTGDESLVQETKAGLIVTEEVDVKADERAILECLQVTDYLTSNGRDESEITWKSKRAWLTEEKATDLFGADTAKKLSFDSFPETVKRDRWRDEAAYDGRAEIWEIHCEESGEVYFLQGKGNKSFLEKTKPELKFEGFYPCEVINASIDPLSTIPTSDYVHCRDQVLEVERLTSRIHAVTQAIRTNGFYDATLGKDIENMMVGDLKMIPVMNWPSYKARGGLAAGMEVQNIEPYVNALNILTQARETALQKLYEITKASDLLRGVSDPNKTATANRLENQWSSLGLIVRQNQFANFIGNAIGKLGSVIAQAYSEQKILETGDAETLLAPLTQPDPNNPQAQVMQLQELKSQIIQILRNDTERCYRIKIASDSMVALDERQERQDGVDLMQSAGGFFDQMKGLIEQYPPLVEFAVELFKNVIRRYKGGKEMEAVFSKALMDVSTLAQQKAAQAAQQPPTPGLMEAQARMQIAQMESQAKMQLSQLEAQDKHEKNLIEVQKLQQDTTLEAWKAEQDVALRMEELKIKANAVQVELLKIQTNSQLEAASIENKRQLYELNAVIDQQRVDIEKTNVRLTAYEKLLEEKRLNQQLNKSS